MTAICPNCLSVVLPVLNEANGIAACLQALAPLARRGAQIIVADGGSTDGTTDRAQASGAQLVSAPRGRALQMNAGALRASGDVLLFLHADTLLPPDADRLICQALGACRAWGVESENRPQRGQFLPDMQTHSPAMGQKDGEKWTAAVDLQPTIPKSDRLLATGPQVWGRFDVRIDGHHWLLRVIALLMNLRSRWTGIATGDQAMFMTRAAFDAVGGFPVQLLMEDIEMSRRLLRLSRPACLRAQVLTSGRRWESGGVWRTMLLMWRLRFAYWRGVAPERLVSLYR